MREIARFEFHISVDGVPVIQLGLIRFSAADEIENET